MLDTSKGAYAVACEFYLPFLLCSPEALLAASPSSLTAISNHFVSLGECRPNPDGRSSF